MGRFYGDTGEDAIEAGKVNDPEGAVDRSEGDVECGRSASRCPNVVSARGEPQDEHRAAPLRVLGREISSLGPGEAPGYG